MKVKIVSSELERQGGVNTYVAALTRWLSSVGVEIAADGNYDVMLHVGPHAYPGMPPSNGCRSVIVIHDLIPEVLWKDECVRRERARALAAADAVIAVSEWTKADVVREFGVEPGKVQVVHHGVSPTFFCNASPPAHSPFRTGRYLLYVGKRNGYKRFRWLLRAVAPLMWLHPRLRLLCTGEPFCRREWAWIVALGLWGRVRVQRFSYEEMVGVYGNASVLVYPSVYEGFGLPILEAMAAGCPVVCSKRTCAVEVAGNAATYFDYGDSGGLRKTLLGLLGNDEEARKRRAEHVEMGRERAKLFSWEKCARETAAVLRGGE